MWGVIEANADAVTHNSVDNLKDVLKSAFRSNKVIHVKGACAPFRDHEKAVTASRGFIVSYVSSNVVKYTSKRGNDYRFICLLSILTSI